MSTYTENDDDDTVSYLSLANIPLSPETAQDQERRIRREIANSNERRRMQSINAGFQSLKTLLPHTDGEKLSKVSVAGPRGHDPSCQSINDPTASSSWLPPGRHPAADSRLHLRPGAGEDTAAGSEQPAEALHPGNSAHSISPSADPTMGGCLLMNLHI